MGKVDVLKERNYPAFIRRLLLGHATPEIGV